MEYVMKKLFVGNLSWKATEDSLKQHFESCGKVVSAKIITDQYSGKSKGFGFVEMETAEGAQKAIDLLNEQPMLDRNLRVSLAQERTERRDSGGGQGYSRNGPGGGNGKSFGSPRKSFGSPRDF